MPPSPPTPSTMSLLGLLLALLLGRMPLALWVLARLLLVLLLGQMLLAPLALPVLVACLVRVLPTGLMLLLGLPVLAVPVMHLVLVLVLVLVCRRVMLPLPQPPHPQLLQHRPCREHRLRRPPQEPSSSEVQCAETPPMRWVFMTVFMARKRFTKPPSQRG